MSMGIGLLDWESVNPRLRAIGPRRNDPEQPLASFESRRCNLVNKPRVLKRRREKK